MQDRLPPSGESLPVAGESLPPEQKKETTKKKKHRPLRALTADENDLLGVLRSKPWMVNVQPREKGAEKGTDGTQRQGSKGAEGIVNYLARYVSGTAIGNRRLISDDGQYVTFWYTDYRTDQIKTETVTGGEFVQECSTAAIAASFV